MHVIKHWKNITVQDKLTTRSYYGLFILKLFFQRNLKIVDFYVF